MSTVMKDSQEGQLERVHLCFVSVATFKLGSWSVAFRLSLPNVEGGRDFVPCW